MKTILLTIVTLFSVSAFGQKNIDTDLGKTLKVWNNENHASEANFKQLVNDYPNEWLPKYYLALSETLKTFQSNNKNQNEQILNEVKILVDDLVSKNPLNTEVLNLKALYLTAEIVQNPMVNGGLYYPEVNKLYQKALAINPNNPRSVLGAAEFNINAANYSGADITQDCKNIKKALALFELDKPKVNEPNWGKDRVEALLNNQCKNL